MDLKKRILSLVLALALVLSCVGAFADDAKPIKEIKELKLQNDEPIEYHYWDEWWGDSDFTVVATVDPADYDTNELKWSVSGTAKLLDVSDDTLSATFRPTEPGTATVTATVYDGKAMTKVSKDLKVTINEVKPEKLDITTDDVLTIEIGETLDLLTGYVDDLYEYNIDYTFTAKDSTKYPSYGAAQFLTFSGTNDIVDVTTFGKVFGKAEGTATITAKTFKGTEVKGTVTVKVVKPDASKITKVAFNDKEHSFKLTQGGVDMRDYVVVQPDDITWNDKKLFSFADYLNWQVDDTSVAQISLNGYLSFKKAGKVVVTAYYGDIKDTCTVTITGPEKFEMSFAQPELKVKLNDYGYNQLIIPDGVLFDDDDCKIEVDDTSIIDAELIGKTVIVTGNKNGTAKVTVKCFYDDGTLLSTATFTVVVDDEGTLLTGVSFKKDLYELPYGETEISLLGELVYTPEVFTWENDAYVWTVSDPTIAQIDEYGNLEAKTAGKVKVTVTINGTLTASTTVVIDTIALEKVKFADKKYIMGYSESADEPNHTLLEISPDFTPANATIKNVKFESTNANVATAKYVTDDSYGLTIVVQANGLGKAVITAYFDDGVNVKEASFTVVVTDKITKVTLNKTKKTLYMKPKALRTYQLVAKDATTRAKLGADMIKWKSSNKKVATVDATGLVTAKGVGTCTITATVKDKIKKTATCKITVLKKKNLK